MAGSRDSRVAFLTQSSAPGDSPAAAGRAPRPVAAGVHLLAARGGSSWFVDADGMPGQPALLIDCPSPSDANLAWLSQRCAAGGYLVLTGRHGHGDTPGELRRWQRLLGWPVVVQEQEAYLLPGVERVQPFGDALTLVPGVRLLWTPGPTPGACVLHVQNPGLDGLFCGRLLVPVAPGALAPLRTPATFHWPRQLASLRRLLDWLPPASPSWIATGAGLGALRGGALVETRADWLRTAAAQGFC